VGQADKITAEMKEATHYFEEKRYSEALEDANAVLDMAPQNAQAYFLRGNIYAKKRNWAEAEADFKSALRIKGSSVGVTFNLAELQFMQKNYDVARPGFLSLKDSDMGDLAMFKVFLCDLFGGHDKVAARELAAFNQVGSNASYYFANIAWSLFYHQADDARDWLASAQKIYSPSKVATYSTSLVELGYLPLPQAPDVATIH
jgi:tetratricopeptide (TPR) repeat protein